MDIPVCDTSNEQRLETADDVLNMLDHVMDRFEKRLTLNDPRLVEHYLKIRLNLLVRFRIDLINVDCLALFRRADQVTGIENEVWINDVAASGILEKPSVVNTVRSGCGCYHQAVLVDIVELVEPPERFIPSLVRLGTVDSISRHLRHALYFSLTRLGGYVFFGSFDIKDREINVPLFSLGERSALIVNKAADSDKLIGEMIESGPHIEENIPGDGPNVIGNGFDFGKVINAMRAG
jgi:hypothetical protein